MRGCMSYKPGGAGRCAGCGAGVAAGLENKRLACVAVAAVGVAASAACSASRAMLCLDLQL